MYGMGMMKLFYRGRGARPPVIPRAYEWTPRPIGPRFEWLDGDHIRLLEGGFAGRQYRLVIEVRPDRASIFLQDGDVRVGQCLVERSPPGEGVVLWDIGVRSECWRRGLASVMTWCIFRELLSVQQTASFRIRMITSVKPGAACTEVRNLGICVVGNRLGLNSSFDVETLLRPENVNDWEMVPAREGVPPGLKVTVRSYPLVLIGFILDRETMRPVQDERTYLRLLRDLDGIRTWFRDGLLVISNGDYVLRAGGFDRFLDGIAVDAIEAHEFRQRLRPL